MNINYHISEPLIKCPYCDKEQNDEDYEVASCMGEKVVLECPHCMKVFYAEAHISYDTHADCELNKEKHVFHQSPFHSTLYHCGNCPEYEVRNDFAHEKQLE